jgi:hypothetical protein
MTWRALLGRLLDAAASHVEESVRRLKDHSKPPEEFDPLAPSVVSYQRVAAALKSNGFDPTTMQVEMEPGDLLIEFGKPAGAYTRSLLSST